MRVLIVEEALIGLHGHWFQYISDIIRDGKKAGYDVEVAVPKDASPEIISRLPCRPILTQSLFAKTHTHVSHWGSLKRILKHNISLYRDLNGFLNLGHSYDLIISTTTRVDHLFAYEFLLRKHSGRSIKKLVLIFIDTIASYSKDLSEIRFSKKLLLLKVGIKMIRFLSESSRIVLATESEGVAAQYRLFSGAKLSVLPHVTVLPKVPSFEDGVGASSQQRPLTLATYGFTRYDKGLDVLQKALKLRKELTNSPELNFVLQWTGDYQMPDGSWVRKDALLEESPHISFIPPFVTSDEYYHWIAITKIMILPYRRGFYHDRLSRVAIDAALSGIPIIYPKGTWLESFVAGQASGVPFIAEDPASLADAIQEAVSRYDELKSLALMRMSHVADAFSAKAFFEAIRAI